jgi:predicted secreted protein
MKIQTIIFLALVLLCSTVTLKSLLKSKRSFTRADLDDGVIKVDNGETFQVKLAGNATTGYGWKLISFDQELISPVGLADNGFGSYQPYPTAGRLGTGGDYVFEFNAIDKGKADLEFHYKRVRGEPDQIIKTKVKIQ